MTDDTQDVSGEVGNATPTEQSQSGEPAQEKAPEEETQAEDKTAQPEKEDVKSPTVQDPAGVLGEVKGYSSGFISPQATAPSLSDRLDKIESDHRAFVKKLDDQYGIR